MRKFLKFTKILIIFITLASMLSSCQRYSPNINAYDNGDLLNLKEPSNELNLSGKWKLMSSHYAGEETDNQETSPNEEIFISNKVFIYGKTQILDPKVSARYVRLKSYLSDKLIVLPESLEIDEENVTIYKFQDSKLKSQELIQLSDERLIAYENKRFNVYEKYSKVGSDEETAKYNDLWMQIESDNNKIKKREYALSIGVRKDLSSDSDTNFDYKYQTYFIENSKDLSKPRTLEVANLVFYKDSVLWSVEHDRRVSESDSQISLDSISAHPVSVNEGDKVNKFEDVAVRRIDYLNDNYLAMTTKNSINQGISEQYEIQNLNQLSMNQPLKINNIGGADALNKYNEEYNKTLQAILNTTDNTLGYASKPDETNIGIKRDKLSWTFKSNIRASVLGKSTGYAQNISLKFTPIIDIATNDNKSITWKDVQDRVNTATAAFVAPDGNTIIIQDEKQIQVYSVYNNIIAVNPELTILKTDGTEIVMTKWYPLENSKDISTEYRKLPAISPRVKYPGE